MVASTATQYPVEPLEADASPPAAERAVDADTRSALRAECLRLGLSAAQAAVVAGVSLASWAKVLAGATVAPHVRAKAGGALARLRAATHRGELRIP